MAQSEIESNTRKIISKQSTQQLQSKLENGSLLGLSKNIALEVIEKRNIKTKAIIKDKETKILPKKLKVENKSNDVSKTISKEKVNSKKENKLTIKQQVKNLIDLDKTNKEIIEKLVKEGLKEKSIKWYLFELNKNEKKSK